MTTPTPRYGLAKIVLGSDNVDVVADFNNNWDALDLKLGTQVCTSTTRPASPVQGMLVFETDTGFTRKYKGAAWEQVGIAACTSGARPSSNLLAGDLIFETNTGYTRTWTGSAWQTQSTVSAASSAMPANPIVGDLVYVNNHPALAMWNGSVWLYETTVICTSSTRPVSFIVNGTQIYETDTGRFLTYNGTTWVNTAFSNFVCTAATHPANPFQGLEIFETDTLLSAIYSGSNYLYAIQQGAPTQILVAPAATVTLAVPAGANSVMVKWKARASDAVAAEQVLLRFNADSTAGHYLWEKNESNNTGSVSGQQGGSTTQTSIQIGTMSGASATANYFGSGDFIVDGVNDATNFATVSGKGGCFATNANMWSGTYNGQFLVQAAITSMTFSTQNSSNFVAGSRFSIYAVQ